MMKHQHGSTLIVVLILLLLITIAGAMAIRQSVSSLKLVTGSQIQAVLLRSSDAAMVQIQSRAFIDNLASSAGVIGFLRNPANANKELLFCFKSVSSGQPYFFDMTNSSILDQPVDANGVATVYSYGSGGICTNGQSSSGRDAVYTQVAFKKAAAATTPFSDLVRGTDLTTSKTEGNQRVVVYATSYLPAFSGSSVGDGSSGISACFKQLNDAVTNNVVSCLAGKNVPYSAQVAEFRFQAGFQ